MPFHGGICWFFQVIGIPLYSAGLSMAGVQAPFSRDKLVLVGALVVMLAQYTGYGYARDSGATHNFQ